MALTVDEQVAQVTTELPRRYDANQMHEAEFDLHNLVRTVRHMGEHPKLNAALRLLAQAGAALSDYIDSERVKITNPVNNNDGSMSVTVPDSHGEGYNRVRVMTDEVAQNIMQAKVPHWW